MNKFPESLRRLMRFAHVDLDTAHQRVSTARVVAATVLAVAASLAVDGLLVATGTHLFPSTVGYVHFQFSDYAKLTVIGVLFACAGWPVLAFVSPNPRWLYSRLALLGTLVLYLPDLWLLWRGQPAQAVAVLMSMHFAVILVTYGVMVHLAPVIGEMWPPLGRHPVVQATRSSDSPRVR